MTAPPLDQQDRDHVRTCHGETLFVQAGAGTGKTTALVARVVDMVATGHLRSVDQLAAITFTENAAAELRSRVREGLAEAALGAHRGVRYDEDAQRRCAAAAGRLDDAVITTLHGFASRILSEAPLETGLPPGFTVADTMGAVDTDEQAWQDFLDGLLDDGSIRDHLVAGLTLGLKLTDLRAVADELSASWDRLRSRPLRERPLPPVSADRVLAALREALAGEERWPDDALAAHLRGPVTSLVTELGALEHPMDLLEALHRAEISCSAGRAPDWKAAGLDKTVVVDALKEADARRDEVVRGVGAAVTETLAGRVQDWLLREADRRRDEGTLEFHDLLVLARDVLRRDGEVRRRLHEQWPVLLVDEFQDTDPLQVEIVYLLAGTCDDDPPAWSEIEVDRGRLFFVGDAKQSIYRFRRADVAMFTAVGASRVVERRPALSINFRSVPGILDATNHAFRQLIGADPDAGIPYEDLRPARTATTSEPPVLLLGGPQDTGDAAALRQAEATHLADVIVRAKTEPWHVEATVERADGTRERELRPASYQDIAILLPTRTSLPAIERALQERSVPYRVESRSLVWSTDAVRDLVTLLQAIDSPADEVALLAALRHPGLACSDVDLVTWRAAGGQWSLFAPVPDGLDGEHPVAAALATLRAWHDQRWWLPVNELVEQVVRELRLVELTASQRRPRDHWRRLRFVVDQARAWCDAGGSGLGGFVAWAMRQIENDADVLETVVPESDDDAVRILTVHGSKGLEFPITMVAGLSSLGGGHLHVLWGDHGPQVRLRAGTLEMPGWAATAAGEKEQARRESIRLLYVALTRAMDHLVIGGYHKPPKTKGAQRTAAQQLWERLGDADVTRLETAPVAVASTTASVSDHGAATALPDRVAFAADRAALLADLAQRVATSPTALTAHALGDDEPAKPGELADVPVEEFPDRRRRTARRGSRRGAAIGTAVHRVLELVDLATPAPGEVRRLAELACAEQDIAQLVSDVEGRVWSALAADVVRDAAASGRSWREVYLVVQDGERYVEGYVDLLAESGDGGLKVVDYKTDRAETVEEVAAKQARYAPQLDAYVSAVRRVTGRRPVSAELVFARPGGAASDDPTVW